MRESKEANMKDRRKLAQIKCPICKKRGLPDQRLPESRKSFVYQEYVCGTMSFRKARWNILISHVRHMHTPYEHKLSLLKGKDQLNYSDREVKLLREKYDQIAIKKLQKYYSAYSNNGISLQNCKKVF